MKSIKLTIAILMLIAVSLNFTACKKDSSTVGTSDASIQTQTDDQVMVSNETDDASNDGTAAIENKGGSFAERPAFGHLGISLPCDTTTIIVDTTGSSDSIFVNYSGSDCTFKHVRSGKIIISFAHTGIHWNVANATITLTYKNFKVIRDGDHKTITVNGTETITNVTGGLLRDIQPGDSVVHTISANLIVTFGGDSTATWNISKRRVFTYNSTDGLVISTTGSISGVNRFGNAFNTTIISPIVIKQNCNFFSLVSGEISYTAPVGTITATYGLDAQGNPVTSCPLIFYYELQYKSYTYIAPYF